MKLVLRSERGTVLGLDATEDNVTLVDCWDEAVGTDEERLGREYEVVRPWPANEAPVVVHLTDRVNGYLFALVKLPTPGRYGCRHSNVSLNVLEAM